jgi:thiol:disulfide interchange protein/DsbC/DsbD-like thiol-disulfide interchange protein
MHKINQFDLKKLNKWLFLLLMILGFSQATFSDDSIPKVIVKLTAQKLTINGEDSIAVSFSNEPHWHTYWKNPGDAGLPIKLIDTETGEILESYEWPAPKRYIEPGNAWAYGFENEYTLFFKPLKKDKLKLQATWLVCKHICIPGKANIDFDTLNQNEAEISPSSASMDSIDHSELKKRFVELPKKDQYFLKEIDLILVKNKEKEDTFTLFYNLNKSSGNYLSKFQNLLFPFPHPLLDFKHENLYLDNDGHLYAKMNIEWNGYYVEPEVPFPSTNKLDSHLKIDFIYTPNKDGQSKLISKTFKSLSPNGQKIEQFYELLSPVLIEGTNVNDSKSTAAPQSNKKTSKSVLSFILLAFLGGLILNLMPCVLPVITLKLFSLTSISSESNKKIAAHNLFYSLGVLSTFWLLALIISALKLSGTVVGWGFQLQSPVFILVMATGLFIFSLNMFGLFEFITPGGKSLGGIKTTGKAGDFLNGVLATILSTPCSAPFLGTALAFAFTQGTSIIFLIFTFIGVGLAFPFILTIFFPSLIKFFPRPGNWMNTLKSFLGLSLLCTSIWLLSILNTLTDSSYLIWVLVSFSFLFYGIYLYQHSKYKKILLFIFSVSGILIMISNYSPGQQSLESFNESNLGLINKAGLDWEKWSEKKLQDYQDKRILTFVDFTADWCLTCKVNEKVVINSESFRKLIKDNQISLLLGDWTNGEESITNWLLKNDMAGVPAYFFIDRNGKLHNLGETISVEKIKEIL